MMGSMHLGKNPMFGDSIVLSVGGTNRTCHKVNNDNFSSNYMYRDEDQEILLNLRNSKTSGKGGKAVRDRHNVEIVHTVYATVDALERVVKTYFVTEKDRADMSIALPVTLGLWLSASSGANVTMLQGWRS